jgi:hypothetical protein
LVGLEYLHNGYPPGNYLQARRAVRFQPWQGGVQEVANDQVPMTRSGASVVCGVLWVPPSPSPLPEGEGQGKRPRAALLDITGRKVADLCPGANDVRGLAPGVYFVRPAGTVPAGQGTVPIRAKVVVTR